MCSRTNPPYVLSSKNKMSIIHLYKRGFLFLLRGQKLSSKVTYVLSIRIVKGPIQF